MINLIRIRFFKFSFILSLFLIGTTNLFSQTFYITDLTTWNAFIADVNATGAAGKTYILMDNIGTSVSSIQTTAVTSPITGSFQGIFIGNNKKIVVNINSSANYVGLFCEMSGGSIQNLVIDGTVTGGPNTKAVGAFVGIIMGIGITTNLTNCLNLTNVSCENPSSSVGVGGIVGEIRGSFDPALGCNLNFNLCVNNGKISGGDCIGGIVGTVACYNQAINFEDCKNAGIIGDTLTIHNSVGGIVGLVISTRSPGYNVEFHIKYATNIGKILSSTSSFAGGIIGYFICHPMQNGMYIRSSVNAGWVCGATNSAGGIVGRLDGPIVDSCLVTNWIDTAGQYTGAIVGCNLGSLAAISACYFNDNTTQPWNGVGNGNGIALSYGTSAFIAINSYYLIWKKTNQIDPLYIMPNPPASNIHPIDLLAAAPLHIPWWLFGNWCPFYVSNYLTDISFVNLPTMTIPAPCYFTWGWFDNGIYKPSSEKDYLTFPAPYWDPNTTYDNLVTLAPKVYNLGAGIGVWDAMSVRYDYPNYSTNGCYPGYQIMFEKIVPMRVFKP